MSIVSVAMAKAHLRIDSDHEDELIELYIGAAEEKFENHSGVKLSTFNPVPNGVKRAILALTEFYYQHRGTVSFDTAMKLAPFGFTQVADEYRKRWFGAAEQDDADDF